jgi:hypothetical protein
MTWESANPAAVVDEESHPPVVIMRCPTLEEAEHRLDYLWEHSDAVIRAKIDRGGYGIDVKQAKKKDERVAPASPVSYTRGNAKPPNQARKSDRKAMTMPPRGRRASAPPVEPEEDAVEETEAGGEFDHHLTKNLSPTMQDYAEWFHGTVTDIEKLGKTDPDRLLALGSTLYPHFQKSDMNQERREARKAERASAVADEEPEEEPAPKPAKRGRTAAPAAAAKPAAAKPAAPARAKRGRPAAAAEAPY